MSRHKSLLIAAVWACAIAYLPSQLVRAELVGYWNFDENVEDRSDSGNDGVLFGGTYSDNVPTEIGTGQSIDFASDTDRVFIEADGSLDSEEFTLAMFVFDRGQFGALERLTSRENDTFETAINVHPPFDGTGELAYYSGIGGGWQWTGEAWGADNSIVLEEETWQHVAYVANADDESMSIYLNGEIAYESSDPWFVAPSGFMHIGNRYNDLEGFDGLLDDVALWDEVLSPEQIKEIAEGGVARFLNLDPLAPLNDGSLTDPDERLDYVHNTLDTWMGDSNFDLLFDSSDLVAVFSTGKYETLDVALWEEGDWNGDMVFDSSDMVTAFSDGGYEIGPHSLAIAVPEPAGLALLAVGWCCYLSIRQSTSPNPGS